MGKWDKSVDYNTMYNLLVRLIRRYSDRRKCYSAILLIQLRNGLRISESVRAFKEYIKTSKPEFEINVSKKKKPEKRLVVIPPEILSSDLSTCLELFNVEDRKLVNRVRAWFYMNYKINTHSLRYAFITYLLRSGVNPAIISKITKHSKLDFILTYTQEKTAVEVLKNM